MKLPHVHRGLREGGGEHPLRAKKKGGFAGWWDDTLAMSSSPETGRLWADPIFSPSVKTFFCKGCHLLTPHHSPLAREGGTKQQNLLTNKKGGAIVVLGGPPEGGPGPHQNKNGPARRWPRRLR